MNLVAGIGFVATVLLFLFILWDFLFKKKTKDFFGMFDKWKFYFFLMILITFSFLLFFVSSMYSVGVEKTITSTYETFYIRDNAYLELINYLPLIVGIYSFSVALLVINIISEFQLFGKPRLGKLS